MEDRSLREESIKLKIYKMYTQTQQEIIDKLAYDNV